MKNREIIENVWKILLGDGTQKREVSGQNGRVGISAKLRKNVKAPSAGCCDSLLFGVYPLRDNLSFPVDKSTQFGDVPAQLNPPMAKFRGP